MQPKFDESGYDCPPILLCPKCGFDYLHHEKIEIFERQAEDDKQGLHLVVASRADSTVAASSRINVLTNTDISENPSRRRNGMKISFWCEGCDVVSVLVIEQHKGQTFMDFAPGNKPEGRLDGIPDEYGDEQCSYED